MSEELKNYLQSIASIELPEDDDEDFNPCDYAGGNFDDAYSMGCTSGEVHLARNLLSLYGEVDEV